MCILQLKRERQPADFVVVLTGLLSVYYLYYGCLRLKPDHWNERESHVEEIKWNENEKLNRFHQIAIDPSISSDITVVSAFFDIGDFQKGTNDRFTPNHYFGWMEYISRLDNKFILFTDSNDIFEKASILRSRYHDNQTQLHFISRDDLKAFKKVPEIKEIFRQPGYPRHHPNTVNENYSACMHSKYELISKVIEENMTNTKYIAWMDLGLFRNNLWETESILLQLPPGFDSNKIGYNEVHERTGRNDLAVETIVRDNLVWVGGGLFVGRIDLMYVHCKDYMNSVDIMLKMKWLSTDQQVLYSMYLDKFPVKTRVEVQVFSSHAVDWYHIAHTMKDIKDKTSRKTKRLSYYTLYYV